MQLDLARVDTDSDYRNEARHRCVTDHFYLADLLGAGFDRFLARVHQPVVDLYFPKNPGLPIEQQHEKKNRLHLDPRGTYKTTMGRVDSLQWILAFPEEITILNETATKPLAEAISASIAAFFYKPKDVAPTPLQRVFPELCVEKKPTGIWDTPVRLPGSLDTTLAFTSPRASQSGWHPWVECIDDMVDTENSGIHASADLRQSVIDTYYTNKNTLRPGGYINLRGTRYHPFELYGDVLDKMDADDWKVLIRSAMTIKSNRKLLPGEFPDRDDVILNFPEMPGMDYRSLRQKFFDDYESFMCQQQNDPQGGHIATFDEDLYKSMLIAPERIPNLGDTYICWRLPYGGKEYMAGLAEGAAARVYEGKVYILDAWGGNYTPSRLAEKIVRESKEHQAQMLMLEDLPGTEYMEGHIRNEALRKNVSVRMQWMEFQDDDNCRFERIKQLEPQARAGRVLISTASGKAGELKRQLCNFGLVRENGIVDAISRLAAKVPISLMRQEIEDEEAETLLRRRQDLMYHFIYGGIDHSSGLAELESRKRQEQEAQAAAMESVNNLGLTDILGGLDG
jgi:hypothetical protein